MSESQIHARVLDLPSYLMDRPFFHLKGNSRLPAISSPPQHLPFWVGVFVSFVTYEDFLKYCHAPSAMHFTFKIIFRNFHAVFLVSLQLMVSQDISSEILS